MFSILLIIIYIAFISLGLPDSLLGSAWPVMHKELSVPISFAGAVTMIIAGGTIVSSLLSDKLTRKFGTGGVTAFSVFLTAAALFGFSISNKFWMLCALAVPYGLGAGAVDAALNNFVALHFKSRHMSWLHCFWGVGAAISPYIMGYALTGGLGWNSGYRIVAIMQISLAAMLFITLPLWTARRKKDAENLTVRRQKSAEKVCGQLAQNNKDKTGIDITDSETVSLSKDKKKPKSLREILRIKGLPFILITFLSYCALESTTMLWASSFLVQFRGIKAETAAVFASLFFLGLTSGRFLSGCISYKVGDKRLIRLGIAGIFCGIILLFIPDSNNICAMAGLVVTGFGCAPVYPAVIHSTPANFGRENSQAVIGVQMASAYTGSTFIPPLFGLIAQYISIGLLPVFLLFFCILTLTMSELFNKIKNNNLKFESLK